MNSVHKLYLRLYLHIFIRNNDKRRLHRAIINNNDNKRSRSSDGGSNSSSNKDSDSNTELHIIHTSIILIKHTNGATHTFVVVLRVAIVDGENKSVINAGVFDEREQKQLCFTYLEAQPYLLFFFVEYFTCFRPAVCAEDLLWLFIIELGNFRNRKTKIGKSENCVQIAGTKPKTNSTKLSE